MRRLIALLSCVLALGLFLPASAFAQAGWRLTFTPSPDHDTIAHGQPVVERYELSIAPQAGGQATTLNLSKPRPTAQGVIEFDVNATVLALPPGTYIGRVNAIGSGGTTASAASAPFVLTIPAPGAPGQPGLSRAGS
jgi:hypothetical protein